MPSSFTDVCGETLGCQWKKKIMHATVLPYRRMARGVEHGSLSLASYVVDTYSDLQRSKQCYRALMPTNLRVAQDKARQIPQSETASLDTLRHCLMEARRTDVAGSLKGSTMTAIRHRRCQSASRRIYGHLGHSTMSTQRWWRTVADEMSC